MHLYNKEQAIKRMNQLGQLHRPFIFIINYLQDVSYIEEVAAVDSAEVLYNLNGFTNQATSTEKYTPSFSAKPANSIHWQPSAESFYSYQRSFNIARPSALYYQRFHAHAFLLPERTAGHVFQRDAGERARSAKTVVCHSGAGDK